AYHSSPHATDSSRLAYGPAADAARHVDLRARQGGSSDGRVVSVVVVLCDHRLAVSAVRIATCGARPAPWRAARRPHVQPADDRRPGNVAGRARADALTLV